jgi:hypothetical protein
MLRILKVKFILSVFAFFGGMSNAAFAVNIPSLESGNIGAYCSEQWTKRGVLDQSMYQFCMKLEREGYANLKSLSLKYASQKWIQSAVNFSMEKWTKRNVTQFSMVHFSLNQITEGYEDLIYMQKTTGLKKTKFDACHQEWGIQFNMVVYCYKN